MGQDTLNGKKATQFQEELLKFPSILRKIALQMIKSDEILDISKAAKIVGVSANAAWVATSRARQKGNDFDELVDKICKETLRSQKPKMYKELIKQALKGKYRYLDLYFRLVGDLRPEPKNGPETAVNNLCFVLAMPDSIPQVIEPAIPENNGTEDPGVIDVERENTSLRIMQKDHSE